MRNRVERAGGDMTWREMSMDVIVQTMREYPTESRAEMKATLSGAYPFGPRENYPYKAWLSAVKHALDIKYGYQPTKKDIDEQIARDKARTESDQLELPV